MIWEPNRRVIEYVLAWDERTTGDRKIGRSVGEMVEFRHEHGNPVRLESDDDRLGLELKVWELIEIEARERVTTLEGQGNRI